MKLAANFSLAEFEASTTAAVRKIDNSIPQPLLPNVLALAAWLQTLRDRLTKHLDRPVAIRISSGYRGPALNKAVGGSKNSAHMQALAADITASGMTVDQLFTFIREHMDDLPADQVIHEFGRWVHVAVAPGGDKPRKQFLYAENGAGKTVYRLA